MESRRTGEMSAARVALAIVLAAGAVGFANAFGSSRHMAAALFIKTLGGNARDSTSP